MSLPDEPRRAVGLIALAFLVALLMGAYGFLLAITWMA